MLADHGFTVDRREHRSVIPPIDQTLAGLPDGFDVEFADAATARAARGRQRELGLSL